jgi:catechol-2,3-dioxygenase
MSFQIDAEQDLDRAGAELERRGIRPVAELDNETKRSIFITDPDGMLLEFYVQRTRRPDEVLRAERESASYPL